jgi:hypothetical protein
MTARKMREHLSLAEAEAMQAEATRQGGMLLIYKESKPRQPDGGEPSGDSGSAGNLEAVADSSGDLSGFLLN